MLELPKTATNITIKSKVIEYAYIQNPEDI